MVDNMGNVKTHLQNVVSGLKNPPQKGTKCIQISLVYIYMSK